MTDLTKKVEELRKIAFKSIMNAGGGHTPATLSIMEILTVLYYEILNIDPDKPDDPGRDRFILSKGHACVALYTLLADRGFFDKKHLSTFGHTGTILGGHPDMLKVPGVEASTGALGHGFPIGVGMALAARLDKRDYKVFVVLGDGECQEGSIWEAAMFAPQHNLDNLVVIVDNNKIQAMDYLDKIVTMEPFADKWKAFNWDVREVDGHNIEELTKTCKSTPFTQGKPSLILANTTKGKGVSFMENEALWHYRMPSKEEMKIACDELGIEDLS